MRSGDCDSQTLRDLVFVTHLRWSHQAERAHLMPAVGPGTNRYQEDPHRMGTSHSLWQVPCFLSAISEHRNHVLITSEAEPRKGDPSGLHQ